MMFRATVFSRGIAPRGAVARAGREPRTRFTNHRADSGRLPLGMCGPYGGASRFAHMHAEAPAVLPDARESA